MEGNGRIPFGSPPAPRRRRTERLDMRGSAKHRVLMEDHDQKVSLTPSKKKMRRFSRNA